MLASKYHQEQVSKIDNFIWRMYLSYWNFNEITKTFGFTISHCNYEISSVSAGSDAIFIIILDAHQGYHQVQVQKLINKV